MSRESQHTLESRVLDSRAAGSSLHIGARFSPPYPQPSSLMVDYYDKPMPLFDAMR